jgi:hypothetical protein
MRLGPDTKPGFETIALHSMIQHLPALPLAALSGLITKPPT